MDNRVILLLFVEACIALTIPKTAGLYEGKALRAVICSVLIAAAFAMRLCVLSYETPDYKDFLTVWVSFFRDNGGFKALGTSVGNYNIPYLYFLALFSYSEIRDLYLIKLLSIFFDIVLAGSCSALLGKCGASRLSRSICYVAVLLLPTVFLNGALWGQCDSIYVALAFLGVYLSMDDRPVLSMICIAVSFGFKLQAVFIMPVYAVLWAQKKFKWFHFIVFPVTYVLLVLPAVLLGRPFGDTILLYFNQMGTVGSGLNYNSPSIFAIFDGYGGLPVISNTDLASKAGIVAAAAATLSVLLYALTHRGRLDNKKVVFCLAMLVTVIPFFLPHMHDRYFFAADIAAVLIVFIRPEFAVVPVLVQFASLLGAHAYLKGRYLLMMRYGSYALILVLFFYVILLFSDVSVFDKEKKIFSS